MIGSDASGAKSRTSKPDDASRRWDERRRDDEVSVQRLEDVAGRRVEAAGLRQARGAAATAAELAG